MHANPIFGASLTYMLYTILRPLVKIVLSIYFRKVYFIGKEKIPKGKPLLLACNHPTGFLEPCLMACFGPIPLHFMTRGDFFENPIANWFLRSTHQLPIYRKKDGFSSFRKNSGNFREAIKKLLEKETIVIYIEGSTSSDRQLRPFKKGLGRIAAQLKDADPESDLMVLPACVNFSNANAFRSTASIEVFDPISLEAYDFSEEKRFDTINTLTDDIYASMKNGVFHLDDLSRQDKFNGLLNSFLYRSYPPFLPVVKHSDSIKNVGFKIASNIEKIDQVDNNKVFWSERVNTFDWIKIVLFSPLALVGWILNILPSQLALMITKKKVNSEEFYGPVLVASSLVLYMVYFFILVILSLIVHYYFIICLILTPVLGIVYLYWQDLIEKVYSAKSFLMRSESEREKILKIKKLIHEA